eukprot:RCo000771
MQSRDGRGGAFSSAGASLSAPENPAALLETVERDFQEEVVLVGSVDLSVVQQAQQRVQFSAEDDDRFLHEHAALLQEERALREEFHRRRLTGLREAFNKKLANLRRNAQEKELETREVIHHSYTALEDRMQRYLFRDEALLRKSQDRTFGNQWNAEWAHAARPILVTPRVIRGIKDKLGEGYYVLLCTLYDRIGGTPVTYEAAEATAGKAATPPILHSGRWQDLELRVEARLPLVIPCSSLVKSHQALVFELWKLKHGKYDPVDKVVGWGVHPIVNSHYKVVTGSFKTALIKGPVDPWIDRYSRFQQIYEHNTSHWLGNLYFELHVDTQRLRGDGDATEQQQQQLVLQDAEQRMEKHQAELMSGSLRSLARRGVPPRGAGEGELLSKSSTRFSSLRRPRRRSSAGAALA